MSKIFIYIENVKVMRLGNIVRKIIADHCLKHLLNKLVFVSFNDIWFVESACYGLLRIQKFSHLINNRQV